MKKRIYLQKNRICLEKSSFLEKKVLHYKKTEIANSKIYKNRIYLRKKGDDKNRKKKDFFLPGKKRETFVKSGRRMGWEEILLFSVFIIAFFSQVNPVFMLF